MILQIAQNELEAGRDNAAARIIFDWKFCAAKLCWLLAFYGRPLHIIEIIISNFKLLSVLCAINMSCLNIYVLNRLIFVMMAKFDFINGIDAYSNLRNSLGL